MMPEIICGDCIDVLRKVAQKIDLTFLNSPFN